MANLDEHLGHTDPQDSDSDNDLLADGAELGLHMDPRSPVDGYAPVMGSVLVAVVGTVAAVWPWRAVGRGRVSRTRRGEGSVPTRGEDFMKLDESSMSVFFWAFTILDAAVSVVGVVTLVIDYVYQPWSSGLIDGVPNASLPYVPPAYVLLWLLGFVVCYLVTRHVNGKLDTTGEVQLSPLAVWFIKVPPFYLLGGIAANMFFLLMPIVSAIRLTLLLQSPALGFLLGRLLLWWAGQRRWVFEIHRVGEERGHARRWRVRVRWQSDLDESSGVLV